MPEIAALKYKPRQVLTAGWNALLTIYKINESGGRVLAATKVPGQHGRWKLLVNWPEAFLN
ncbi:MAG TPA: hypothetical protein VJT54_12040 [Verrucomicrobiae bacterium]|nr:hypothetical protein [Verrucomicrobiae bacterium]